MRFIASWSVYIGVLPHALDAKCAQQAPDRLHTRHPPAWSQEGDEYHHSDIKHGKISLEFQPAYAKELHPPTRRHGMGKGGSTGTKVPFSIPPV